jgi:NAD(P)-dependent dehydrogenase (short-subunit alcohol dehydrogenase family)
MSSDTPLAGRLVLVTGASRGLGRACAMGLAKAGAHVIATARTQGALESLDDEILAATGQRATLVPLNLQNGDGIDQLGLAIHNRWGRLDSLFHAAALLGGLSPLGHSDPKVFERVMNVNLTASFRLMRSLEPLLRKSDAGRAIFFTTSRASQPRAFWGAYGASKAALENLAQDWAEEVHDTPIRVSLLDPGRFRTAMRAEAFPGEDPDSLPDPAELASMAVELARPDRTPPIRSAFQEWKASRTV